MATAEWLVRDEFASSYMNIEANNSINIVEATPDKEKDIKVRMLTILLWLADSIIYKGYKSIQQPSCPHPSQSCQLGLRNRPLSGFGCRACHQFAHLVVCTAWYIPPTLSHHALNYLSIPGKSFCFLSLFKWIIYFLQLRLSMSSISSAAVTSSSPMYARDSPRSQPVPFSVSECGASATLSWTMT